MTQAPMMSRFARALFVLALIPLVTTCRGDRFLGLIGPPAEVAVQAGNLDQSYLHRWADELGVAATLAAILAGKITPKQT